MFLVIFKFGTCEKAEITLKGLYYHIKHFHNNKQQFELNMPVKSICYNCKEAFSTLTLLEDIQKQSIQIIMLKHKIQLFT